MPAFPRKGHDVRRAFHLQALVHHRHLEIVWLRYAAGIFECCKLILRIYCTHVSCPGVSEESDSLGGHSVQTDGAGCAYLQYEGSVPHFFSFIDTKFPV
jgi:hypothetical protein